METKFEKFKKKVWRNITIGMLVFGGVGVAFSADDIAKAVRTGDPSRIGAADASTGIQMASLPSGGMFTTKSDFQKIREKVERDGYFQSEQHENVIYFRPLYAKTAEVKKAMNVTKGGRVFQNLFTGGKADFSSIIGAVNECGPTDKLCHTGAYGAMLEALANKEGQIITISEAVEFTAMRIRNLIERKKLEQARKLLPTLVAEAQMQATGAEECRVFTAEKQNLAEYEADVKRRGAGIFGGMGKILRENTAQAEQKCKEASTGLIAATKWEAEGYEAIILAMDGDDEKALAIARRNLDTEFVPFLQEHVRPAYRAFERVIVTIAELSVQTKRGVTGVAALEDLVDGVRVPICRTLAEILKALPQPLTPGGKYFPDVNANNYNVSVRRAFRSFKIEASSKSLRHYAASALYNAGFDTPMVGKILGHAAGSSITGVYIHPDERKIKDAFNALDEAKLA